MTHELDETICALATPTGTGGLGVIRLSGEDAFAIADKVTRHQKPTANFLGHSLHRAEILDSDKSVIDDVLLSVFHAPRSYTGENVVEISAHGGPVPLRRILARLLESGARLAKPGEFTQRAFLNGKMDLAQAEAVGDLIAAQTDEAHKLAQSQQSGNLSREVAKIRDITLGVLAQIEVSIDFPEDVGELNFDACREELDDADAKIAQLLATADRGILTREGLKLALIGRPNVGKSSLLNALLRTARAIVTPIPGTTRDVLEETLNLRGIPVRVMDTAGLRETDDLVEKLGVERSRQSLAEADFIILVLDATVGETPEDMALRQEIASRPHLIVWNKWDVRNLSPPPPPLQVGGADNYLDVRLDMMPESDADKAAEQLDTVSHYLERRGRGGEVSEIPLSALTGWNIDALEDAIADAVLTGLAVPSSDAVVSHARHRHALESARARLADARATLDAELPADFLSIDVRAVLDSLGEITGETATDDIIVEIFSRFCIGK